MGEKKAEAASTDVNAPQQPLAGPGVGSLLRGVRKEEKNIFAEPVKPDPEAEPVATPATPEQAFEPAKPAEVFQTPKPSPSPLAFEAKPKPLIPRWYFFAADVLLIALALGIVFRNPGNMDFKQTVICVSAVGLAAVLGAIGVWMGRKE